MTRALFSPLLRLKNAICPKVSSARATRFCAITLGLGLPAAIGMAMMGAESLARRPAEFIAVSKDPESSKMKVLYRSRDGRLLTKIISHRRSPTDDRGVTLCLRDFKSGKLPLGPVGLALKAANHPDRACSASDNG